MRPWLALIALACVACAPGLGQLAERQARAELQCWRQPLVVQDLGRLWPYAGDSRSVRVFETRGCDQTRSYYCRGGDPACHGDAAALWPGLGGTSTERALAIRRTVSRARCPSDRVELRRESESLWRYRACDGVFQIHCVGSRCERIGTLD